MSITGLGRSWILISDGNILLTFIDVIYATGILTLLMIGVGIGTATYLGTGTLISIGVGIGIIFFLW